MFLNTFLPLVICVLGSNVHGGQRTICEFGLFHHLDLGV